MKPNKTYSSIILIYNCPDFIDWGTKGVPSFTSHSCHNIRERLSGSHYCPYTDLLRSSGVTRYSPGIQTGSGTALFNSLLYIW